jgi:glycosyltransferase involved in cell wall biosynthesis
VPSTCAAPEIAGGAARLIDPLSEADIADALTEVTGSEDLQHRLRDLGLKRVQSLTWRETARRTLSVFNDIVPVEVSPRAETAPL